MNKGGCLMKKKIIAFTLILAMVLVFPNTAAANMHSLQEEEQLAQTGNSLDSNLLNCEHNSFTGYHFYSTGKTYYNETVEKCCVEGLSYFNQVDNPSLSTTPANNSFVDKLKDIIISFGDSSDMVYLYKTDGYSINIKDAVKDLSDNSIVGDIKLTSSGLDSFNELKIELNDEITEEGIYGITIPSQKIMYNDKLIDEPIQLIYIVSENNRHFHLWNFSTEGTDTAIATCCCDIGSCPLVDRKVELKIKADSVPYSGECVEAELVGLASWADERLPFVEINYFEGKEQLSEPPKKIGDYKAECVIDSSNIIYVNFSITKLNGPAAPTGLKGIAPSVFGAKDGKITGTTSLMEYSVDDGLTWLPASETETGNLFAGDVYVRFKETEMNKPGDACKVTIPDGYKAPPTATPTVAPTATPTVTPTATPTIVPTATPTVAPTATPTVAPTASPLPTVTPKPTIKPTVAPTFSPKPTNKPTKSASKQNKSNEFILNSIALGKKLKIKTGKKISIGWGAVKGADCYSVFMSYCGKKKPALAKTVDALSTSATISKIQNKPINEKKNVKCYVVAYKLEKGKKIQIAKTLTAHAVGKKYKKATNPKKLVVKQKIAIVKKGNKLKIKPTITKVNKKLPLLSKYHSKKFRYISADDKVATVSKSGIITAKGIGKCYIYIYAINGLNSRICINVR